MSFSLPVTGPVCRASLEVWGKWGGAEGLLSQSSWLNPPLVNPHGKESEEWESVTHMDSAGTRPSDREQVRRLKAFPDQMQGL